MSDDDGNTVFTPDPHGDCQHCGEGSSAHLSDALYCGPLSEDAQPSPPDFDALRAKAIGASMGPWTSAVIPHDGAGVYQYGARVAKCQAVHFEQESCERNAEYIAAANPTTVLALLDRLKAAESCRTDKDEAPKPAPAGDDERVEYIGDALDRLTAERDAAVARAEKAEWAVANANPLRALQAAEFKTLDDKLTAALAERDKLAAFKLFVHKRLDDAGVPADPPGEHRDAGCRIGQRLDWVMAERDRLRDAWIAARAFIREIKAAVGAGQCHEDMWDMLAKYDQRNHDADDKGDAP